jgi:dihydrofolate synthase/folylpolyglutamate synthase
LKSLGFKVGLSVSPVLLDVRERIQINNHNISEIDFCKYLNEIIPSIKQVSITHFGSPSYFEILSVLTYHAMYKLGVDYAVIETGLGGLLDGTNVVSSPSKVAVITQIGLDHTAILGKTLSKIAYQKAGIIKKRNTVITIAQTQRVIEVIKKESLKKGASLSIISKKNLSHVTLSPTPKFNFSYLGARITDIRLNMLGSFQVQNCSLALSAVTLLSQRDKFDLDDQLISKALKQAIFPGRMQQMLVQNQKLILDGAHNPQKMRMLTKNLSSYYPGQKFTFLLALKHGKDYIDILKQIVPVASKIYLTSFHDQTKSQGTTARSENTRTLAQIFRSLKYRDFVVYEDSHLALQDFLHDQKSIGVITGSLYLLSDLYPILKKLNKQIA